MSTLFVNTISPNSGDTVSVSGSLFVSGTINLGDANTDSVSFGADVSSSIIPDAADIYDLGSVSKPWRKLHGTASAASHSLTATTAATSSHLEIGGFTRSTISASFGSLNITNNITASAISCSGTIIADAFQSTGNDDTLSFEDNLRVSGSIVASSVLSGSSAAIDGDVTVGDDLSLISDSAVFNMGAGNDFKITHDGTTGAHITGNPILVHSLESTLSLSGSAAVINATTGDVSISAGDDIALSAADDISLTSTSEDGLITLHSAHTAGQSILIDANAAAGSILDVDAGILDIDVQGAATLDAVGIALNAGSGELDLTTIGTLDVNANALDMDLTDSSDITLTSSEAAEDLTISQVGANDSSIIITAAGTGADAIKLDATAGSMLIAPSLADEKTLKIGKNGAAEMVFSPHGTAASEKISITNTAGTADDAVSINAALGAITLESLQTIIESEHPKLTVKSNAASGDGSIIFKSGDGSTMATIRCDVTSNVMNHLAIGSGTNDTHLVLDANGKIGLGVQTPGEVLTVAGNISASGALTAGALTANGAVDLNATTLDIDASGLVTIDSVGLSIDSAGVAANITSTTDGAAEDFTIALAGATDSSLILSSTGTGADALQITTTAGGIDISATGNAAGEDIDISSAASVNVTATENAANAIYLRANGGTSETIKIHSDQGTGAGSVEITSDAGSIDINSGDNITVDAADDITVTADNVSMVANVTAAKIQSPTTAVTATDAGAAIPAGTAVALVNADSDANHIVILPAPVVGNIIHIIENGTTGYELRTSTPASIGINGGTASNGESAIAGAITYVRCVCVSSTSWIATQFDADGDESKVEAAA